METITSKYETMNFHEATRLPNNEFAKYAEAQNRKFSKEKRSKGWIYFPSIDRWFPAETQIAGIEPGPHPIETQ